MNQQRVTIIKGKDGHHGNSVLLSLGDVIQFDTITLKFVSKSCLRVHFLEEKIDRLILIASCVI